MNCIKIQCFLTILLYFTIPAPEVPFFLWVCIIQIYYQVLFCISFSILCPIGALKTNHGRGAYATNTRKCHKSTAFSSLGPDNEHQHISSFIAETYGEATEAMFLIPFCEPSSLCHKVSLLPLLTSSSAASLPTSPKAESHLSLDDW